MKIQLSTSLILALSVTFAPAGVLADEEESQIVIKGAQKPDASGNLSWSTEARQPRSTAKEKSVLKDSTSTASIPSVKPSAAKRAAVPDPASDFFHQGHFIHRNSLGEPAAEGEYRQGKRIGRWVRWYRQGEGDMFSGPFYDEFQRPFVAEVEFVDGVMTGLWTVSDSKGRKIGQWELDEDMQPHGKAVWYYANGNKMREVDYDSGLVHGKLQQWEKDGQLRITETYREGRQLTTKSETYPSGRKQAEGAYMMAGQINRCACDWWSGTVTTTKEAEHLQDDKDGLWTWYYEDGRPQMQGVYASGIASGKFTWWYRTGQRQIEGSYIDGKQHGRWDWWYIAGMKQRRGQYSHGDPTGRWTSYNEDGGLREIEDNFTADTPNQTLSADDPLAPKKEPRIVVQQQAKTPVPEQPVQRTASIERPKPSRPVTRPTNTARAKGRESSRRLR